MKRREAIKHTGLAGLLSLTLSPEKLFAHTSEKPVEFICIGAGNRGNFYSRYAAMHPGSMKLTGVAEPIPERRKKFGDLYEIPEKNRFTTWEYVFDRPKFADAVLVTTPDQLHFGPLMRALDLGYHVLVEKPISPSYQECLQILEKANKSGKIVAVCHVLRYAPYFRQLKKVTESGLLGNLTGIDHFEPVGYWHMAHSYVRGNWRRTDTSTFMLLAKSCHDMDIMRWLAGENCLQISSFGSLKHFRKENAPAGSTLRCTDGCAVEKTCPYSAMRLYLDMNRKDWPVSVITEDMSYEGRLKALKEGPYGRCVYHCDNDVVDHQVVSMQFDKQITGNFNMSGFTPQQGMGLRKTRLLGDRGYLEGNMSGYELFTFADNVKSEWNTAQSGGDASTGHGGGDYVLVHDFIEAINEKNPRLLSSTLDVSIESHLMAFKAEESRLTSTTIKI